MSAVAPDAGGSVVISQVRPQNADGQSHNAPANMPKPLVPFYRGEPEVLGTTQIFVGILLLSLGIVLIIVETKIDPPGIVTVSGIPIWSGILFIISGSLSVSASRKPTAGKPVGGGLLSYVLLLFLLMLCISISTSVFACRTVCRTSFEETTVVIYQTTNLHVPDTTRDVPPDYSAAVTSDLKAQAGSH
ncbi:membrane-spanning 4-domains subfamily A member 4A-like isoform X2 [Eleutherodactylus coqui]|uniref:membrane-spanning 4-domains subfamily A member 4A-like isoform X2 n=1 Tax=Eleutherodactylus coqui TaxID=57060 RepID=UPI003461EB37